ncbi:Lrp/AsnC family transcriptional regulator [Aliiglaciecola lipolytica]|uniref:Leucine-responsive regulatory protein, putative n=1 Tax=Aliiglaciecola lipolytica E3 TaxID=1127673 RepID=K6XUZ9_9ALTE|nr:Lrp/AsnC family transcriptional regulator [Aliiglaciecola lipolytica]GAC15496.1 leucine-responsive regulatory protein, putative [Aliiglaciecola lipolytica E3]
MNDKDKQIISRLEQDGRLSFATLGESIGLSKTPCWNRVKTLQKNHVITGFSADISPQALGLNIRALVHVVINIEQHQKFEQSIINHVSVRSCHAVTGEFDYVLEVLAKDINHFDELLRVDLSRLPGVLRFNTSITTRMIKQNGPYSKML